MTSKSEILDRLPPSCPDAERAVIAGIISDPKQVASVAPILRPEDFHSHANGVIYRNCLELVNGDGKALDIILLEQRLAAQGILKDIGGAAYLAELRMGRGAPSLAPNYAKLVRGDAQKRELIAAGLELVQGAHDPRADVTGIRQTALERIQAIGCDAQMIGDPMLTRLDSITPKLVRPLWPRRFYLGKLGMSTGHPGLGKSLITLDMTARITTGRPWPDDPATPTEPGDVLLITCEDDPEDTIVPRLIAARADLSRVHILRGVHWYDSEARKAVDRAFSLDRDIDAMRKALDALPKCRMIVFDPITAYLGRIDSHKAAEVRSVLSPLAELAAEREVAVSLVNHLNKGTGPALTRSMGSIAFIASVRVAWGIVRDEENPARRLMLPIKNNLAPDNLGGLAYEIQATPEGLPVITWDARPVHRDVDEALAPDQQGDRSERREAREWLRELLGDGPLPAKEIEKLGKESGHSLRTLQRVKNELDVLSHKEGIGLTSSWVWSLPTPQEGQKW